MLDEITFLRQQNSKRNWFVALSVAVGCCVIFSVMMIYFVTTWGKTLNAIDNRLANLEMRSQGLPSLPPSAAAVPVPEPELPSAAPLEATPVSVVGPAVPPDTIPSAPEPSNEEPPSAATEPQMSVPPHGNVFIPAPSYPEPSPLP